MDERIGHSPPGWDFVLESPHSVDTSSDLQRLKSCQPTLVFHSTRKTIQNRLQVFAPHIVLRVGHPLHTGQYRDGKSSGPYYNWLLGDRNMIQLEKIASGHARKCWRHNQPFGLCSLDTSNGLHVPQRKKERF